jgi:hypothetical protein
VFVTQETEPHVLRKTVDNSKEEQGYDLFLTTFKNISL